MSFQGLTPELLVQRNDSKNPATTCKGLTTSGRPCRRGLGESSSLSPGRNARTTGVRDFAALGEEGEGGVVAILDEGDAAAWFCWQHKGQAANLVAASNAAALKAGGGGGGGADGRRRTRIVPLKKQSSIDTLAEKVGVLDLDGESQSGFGDRVGRRVKVKRKRREMLPDEWRKIEGPLMSVPEEEIVRLEKRERVGRSNVKASWGCCLRADDYDDDGPPARRRDRDQERLSSRTGTGSYSHRPDPMVPPQMQERPARRQSNDHRKTDDHKSPRPSQPLTPSRPPPRPSSKVSPPHSQTQNFLSLIPQHLDPATTSALLSELNKPFAKDDEAGYIYIFWLTPTTEDSVPDDDVASTILDSDLSYQDLLNPSPQRNPDSQRRSLNPGPNGTHDRKRHQVQQLNRYASIKPKNREPPKILLKIGRAQNIHRRLTQWTKQCNQNITLVRYYPHHASVAADPKSPGGSKVPHVNKVERLIHVELRGMGWSKDAEICAECGRGHREWFEVPATRQGLRGVDGVVKRWVEWAEGVGEGSGGAGAIAGRSRGVDESERPIY